MSQANEPFVRPGMLIGAALVVGGIVAAIAPQHALTIAQVVVVTAAVTAALHVLQVNVTDLRGRRSRGSALDYAVVRRTPRNAPADLQITRAHLERDRVAGGSVALPHGTALQLSRAVATELERQGFDLADPAQRAAARALVLPTTWTMLTEDPRRSSGDTRSYLPADGPWVADVVHTVLDDLDRLAMRTQGEPTEDRPTRGAP